MVVRCLFPSLKTGGEGHFAKGGSGMFYSPPFIRRGGREADGVVWICLEKSEGPSPVITNGVGRLEIWFYIKLTTPPPSGAPLLKYRRGGSLS